MSDFQLVNPEKANEVLTAASADSETADHLTTWCGVSTFPFEDAQYLILAPQGATNDKLTTQDGVYVVEIVSEILLEQIKQYDGCGRPLLQELGYFLLTLEDIENLDKIASFFEVVHQNAQLGMYKTTSIPLPDGFFRPAVAKSDEDDEDIPDEVMKQIISALENGGFVKITLDDTGIKVEGAQANNGDGDGDGSLEDTEINLEDFLNRSFPPLEGMDFPDFSFDGDFTLSEDDEFEFDDDDFLQGFGSTDDGEEE